MTHAEYMAKAGPFTAAEAQAEYLAREAEGNPPTLEEIGRRVPRGPTRGEFVRWFLARQETKGRTLMQVAEDVALDIESYDEECCPPLSSLAARLREAVRLAREGEE